MPKSLQAGDHSVETYNALMDAQLDVTGAIAVDVLVDERRRVLHVNVNGVCLLRVGQIATRVAVDLGGPNDDAALFRRLATNHWSDKTTIVGVLGRDVQLGAQTYSGDLLRAALRRQIESGPPPIRGVVVVKPEQDEDFAP